MAVDNSPEMAQARSAVDRAVKEFVRVSAKEVRDCDDAIVEGWACAVEYTSVELAANDDAAMLSIVPHDQPCSMSIGLFTDAARTHGVRTDT